MIRRTLERALSGLRLVERRAKGQEPGDDALSRLRLGSFPGSPAQWLKTIVSKLVVVFMLAGLAATVFAIGIAVMRAAGLDH